MNSKSQSKRVALEQGQSVHGATTLSQALRTEAMRLETNGITRKPKRLQLFRLMSECADALADATYEVEWLRELVRRAVTDYIEPGMRDAQGDLDGLRYDLGEFQAALDSNRLSGAERAG